MPRRSTPTPSRGTPSRTWLVIGGVVALVVVAAIVAVLLTGSAGAAEPSTSLTVSGTVLPAMPAKGANDDAVGMQLPTLSGTGIDGQPLSIGPTGSPQVIAIVAHWCPHCQAEVPRLVTWLRDNSLPDGVSLTTLSTSIDAARGNFPPSAWLDREGWTAPVLSDDAASDGLAALGVSSFPGFVFVNSDGTVAARATGELEPDQVATIAGTLT